MAVTVDTGSLNKGNVGMRNVWRNPRGQKKYYAIQQEEVSGDVELFESDDGSTWSFKVNIESGLSGLNKEFDHDFIEDASGSQLIVFYLRSNDNSNGPVVFKRLLIADSDSAVTIGANQNIEGGGMRARCRLDRNDRFIATFRDEVKDKGATWYDIVVRGTSEQGTAIPDAPTFSTLTKVTGFDPSTDASANDEDKTDVWSDVGKFEAGTKDGCIFAKGGRTGTANTFDYGKTDFTFDGTNFTFDGLVIPTATPDLDNISTAYEGVGLCDTRTEDATTNTRHLILNDATSVLHITFDRTSHTQEDADITDADAPAIDDFTVSLEDIATDKLHVIYEIGTGEIKEVTSVVDTPSWSTPSAIVTESESASKMSSSERDIESSIHITWIIQTSVDLRYHELSLAVAIVKVVNETVNISEAKNKVLGFIKNVNETINITEAKNITRDLVRVINETVNVSEAINKVLGRIKNVSETVNITEAKNITRDLVRVLNETVNITEATNKVLGFIKNVNETVNITEAKNKVSGTVQVVNEIVNISEAKNKVIGRIKVINEVVNISESKNITRALVRVLNETINITEAKNITRDLIRVLNETVNITEVTNKVLGRIKNVNEIVNITEAKNITRDLVRVLNETVNISEAANKVLGFIKVVNETVNISEAKNIIKGFVKVVNETINISEAKNIARALTRVINENVNISEAKNKVTGLIRVVNETVNITEAKNITRALVRVFNETVNISEVKNITRALVRVANEIVNITEAKNRALGLVRVINEIVNIQEVKNTIVAGFTGRTIKRLLKRGDTTKTVGISGKGKTIKKTDETKTIGSEGES